MKASVNTRTGIRSLMFAGVIFLAVFMLAGCDNFSLIGLFGTTPRTTATTLAMNPITPAVLVGSSVTFVPSGGTTPYAFSVQSGGAGGAIQAGTSVYDAPSGAGVDTVVLTDQGGTSTSTTVTVVAAPQLGISPSSITLATGGTYRFAAVGGVGPYAFSIPTGSAGSVSASGFYTAPTTPGTYFVRVTDSVGTVSDAQVTSAASGGPLVISPACPPDVEVPENSALTFAGSGGTPPYTYSIWWGEGTITTNGAFTAIGPVGAATAAVRLSDSAGESVTSTIDIVPATPTGLTLTAGRSTMSLQWQNNASSASRIEIERKQNSTGAWSVRASVSPDAVGYVDSVSPNGSLYDYRIRVAYDDPSAGITIYSLYSNEAFGVSGP